MGLRDLTIFNQNEVKRLDPNGVLDTVFPKTLLSIEDVGGRSQTDYMLTNFTLDHPTIIGNARQCLQEISSLYEAIKSNSSKSDKMNVYYRGAIKSLVTLCEKYQEYCDILEVDNITEDMVAANQPKEQIMTMFLQSYEEAISNGGMVDAGNLRYARQCGIDPTECQEEVSRHLTHNGEMKVNTPYKTKIWLQEMYVKYGFRTSN